MKTYFTRQPWERKCFTRCSFVSHKLLILGALWINSIIIKYALIPTKLININNVMASLSITLFSIIRGDVGWKQPECIFFYKNSSQEALSIILPSESMLSLGMLRFFGKEGIDIFFHSSNCGARRCAKRVRLKSSKCLPYPDSLISFYHVGGRKTQDAKLWTSFPPSTINGSLSGAGPISASQIKVKVRSRQSNYLTVLYKRKKKMIWTQIGYMEKGVLEK